MKLLLLLLLSCTSKIQSTAKQSWNIILGEKVDPKKVTEELIILDLFMNDAVTISELHAKKVKVICYINAGAIEGANPDFKSFPVMAIGKQLDGYPDERWINIRLPEVQIFMKNRISDAKNKKCDGVVFDNQDSFNHASGFELTTADQIKYTKQLLLYSRDAGLLAGINNGLLFIGDVANEMDFAVNEDCQKFKECQLYDGINFPVYAVEYHNCKKNNLLTIKKNLELDSKREECD